MIPGRLRDWLLHRAIRVMCLRDPDLVIGGPSDPYLQRWYLTPWSRLRRGAQPLRWWQRLLSRLPNIYVHEIVRSDDDRALHDHPWGFLSLILAGECHDITYVAHGAPFSTRGVAKVRYSFESDKPGLIRVRRTYIAGAVRYCTARYPHRLEVDKGSRCLTLVITTFRWREWGFWCPQGWIHRRQFTDAGTNGATVGRGCE